MRIIIHVFIGKIKKLPFANAIIIDFGNRIKRVVVQYFCWIIFFPSSKSIVTLGFKICPYGFVNMLNSLGSVTINSLLQNIIRQPFDDVIFWGSWITGSCKEGIQRTHFFFIASFFFPFFDKKSRNFNILIAFR